MNKPQRPAEIGPRRLTRLFALVLAVLGSAVGVANLPSGANAQLQTQVDTGYLGFETITKPTCPHPHPSPSPSPSPTASPIYSGPPTPVPTATPIPTATPVPT